MGNNLNYWILRKRTVKIFFILLVFFALLYSVISPGFTDYRDRVKVSEIFIILTPIKNQIENEILNNKKIELLSSSKIDGLVNKSKYLDFLSINQEGTIVFFSEDAGTFVELKPITLNKKIEWHCFGLPLINISSTYCRKQMK